MTLIESDRPEDLRKMLTTLNQHTAYTGLVFIEVLDTTRDLLAWRNVEEENLS